MYPLPSSHRTPNPASWRNQWPAWFLTIILTLLFSSFAWAQVQGHPLPGDRGSTYAAPSFDRPPRFPASNPFAASPGPGPGPDSLFISDAILRGILPPIPNLQFGYIYNIGKNFESGRGTADYVLPINLGGNAVLFGEAHAEIQDLWKLFKVTSSAPGLVGATVPTTRGDRVDLSFGGGLRRMVTDNFFFGINAFYDTARVFGTWYSSGSAGLQIAANTVGSSAFDLNLNYYGNFFTREDLINTFNNGGGGFSIEAGYSVPLFNEHADLRVSGALNHLGGLANINGWKVGTEVTTRNGLLTFKYDYRHDEITDPYHSIGGQINVAVQPENLFCGRSPISLPQPVFVNPRNLRRLLSRPVERNWNQVSSAILAKNPLGGPPAIPPGGSSTGRQLILVSIIHNGGSTFTQTGPNSFTLTGIAAGQINDLNYRFMMSDGSIQTVRATISPVSFTGLISNTRNEWWDSMPRGQVLTGTMNGPLIGAGQADTEVTLQVSGFPVMIHAIDFPVATDSFTGQVVIEVPADPGVVPLVITYTTGP